MINKYKKEIEAIFLFESERQPSGYKNKYVIVEKSGLRLKSNIYFHRTLWVMRHPDKSAWFSYLVGSVLEEKELIEMIDFYRPYINKPIEVIVDNQIFMI